MKQIDMSAEAVTSRLRLASELTRLCLKLAKAKIRPGDAHRTDKKRLEDGDKPRKHAR